MGEVMRRKNREEKENTRTRRRRYREEALASTPCYRSFAIKPHQYLHVTERHLEEHSLVHDLVPVGLNLILLEVLKGSVAARRALIQHLFICDPSAKTTHVAMLDMLLLLSFVFGKADEPVD